MAGKIVPGQINDDYKLFTTTYGNKILRTQIFNVTLNSSTGVSCTHNIGSTNYKVSVTPTSNPAGTLGEIWVTKATNTCVIYCSGSTTTTTCDVVVTY